MLKSLFKSVSIFALVVFSIKSHGFVFTVSEKQLNTMLQLSFPIKQSYQQVSVTFSNPRIELNALDKNVSISTDITALQSDKVLVASGTIEGKMNYDELQQTLEFEKPTLTEFKVVSNNIPQSQDAIRHIKQTIGRNLPVIILVDFNQFKFGFGDIIPKDVDITPRGLAITL